MYPGQLHLLLKFYLWKFVLYYTRTSSPGSLSRNKSNLRILKDIAVAIIFPSPNWGKNVSLSI